LLILINEYYFLSLILWVRW